LPPIEDVHPFLRIDPNTGEPPRVITVALAYGLLLVAAIVQAANLGLAWWRAIHMNTFDDAARLLQWTNPVPGSVASIVLAVALIAIGVILVAAPAVSGYLGWVGRPAAPWWALGAVVLSVATLFTTPHPLAIAWSSIGWLAMPISLAAAVLLWLPASRASLAAWQSFRNPPSTPYLQPKPVYGRLEQYR